MNILLFATYKSQQLVHMLIAQPNRQKHKCFFSPAFKSEFTVSLDDVDRKWETVDDDEFVEFERELNG